MSDEPLRTRILQAIREFNGELNWRSLAIAVGVDPFPSDALLAFREAVNSLQHSHAFRLEFDERGTVRFWVAEVEQRTGDASGQQQSGNSVPGRCDEQRGNEAAADRPTG